ncbi:hypothetical protein CRG98_016093, partial [Punica granatum]
MAVFKRRACAAAAATVLVLVVIGAVAGALSSSRQRSSGQEKEEMQSLSYSTMAASWERAGHLNEHVVDDPEEVASMVEMSTRNSTERRKLGFFSCATGNPIDDCWRCDPNWHKNRKRLADCGIGFGRNAIGGRDGRFYV